MTSEQDKRKSDVEMLYVNIFLEYFNSEYSFDYIATRPLIFNTVGVDAELRSASNQYSDLKVECVEAKKEDKYPVFDIDQVQSSIMKKTKKYKEKKVNIKETILLIQGLLGYDWMIDVIDKLRKDNKNTLFKGIYYVYPGDVKEKEYVMDIKGIEVM
jgi:hypothetical protein